MSILRHARLHDERRLRAALRRGASGIFLLGALFAPPAPAQSYHYVGQFGTANLSCPSSVSVDPTSHNVFVGDLTNEQIVVFSPSRAYVSEFGSQGTGDGQFGAELDAIAFDPGTQHILVTDRANDRVQVFDANGGYLSQFLVLTSPVGILFRAVANDILVSADSAGVSIYNSGGSGTGTFTSPTYVGGYLASASNGDVLVTQFGGNAGVARFNTGGTYLSSFGSGHFLCPAGMAADPISGDIVVVNTCGPDNVQVFDANGAYIGQFGGHGSVAGQFDNPNGAAFDPASGHLLVSDCNNHRIQEFTTCGTTLVSLSVLPQTQAQSQSILFSGSIGNVLSPNGLISMHAEDGTLLCTTATYGDPQAACSSLMTLGAHSVTAVWSGDNSSPSGCSAPVVVNVVNDVTNTTDVTLSAPSSGNQGQPFTLTGNVAQGPAPAAPTHVSSPTLTGFMTFYDGSNVMSQVPLSGTQASYSNAFTSGTHSFSARYSGDGNYATSNGAASVTVTKPTDDLFYSGFEVPPGP
jgi:Bacterial Ig-like domain (group 3)/NHL repeat